MAISEQRNEAISEVRSEYLRAKSKVDNDIARRVSSGYSRLRAIADVALDLHTRHYALLSSPPAPGSTERRLPSSLTIRNVAVNLLQQSEEEKARIARPPDLLAREVLERYGISIRPPVSSRAPISPIISPGQRRSPVRDINLGNAVRNLGPVFGMRSPDYRRDERESQNFNSWREESINNLRLMAEVTETRRRNAEDRVRVANHLPPMVDDDIPGYQYNPNIFRPMKLTLQQAISVMNTFDFDLYYRKIKNTLTRYSIKICGFEPCNGEELHLAVFFFIEKYFKFQPVIALCHRPIEDSSDPSAVGVLFERMQSANQIFNNRRVLADTRYSVVRNSATDWIIWNYDG